MALITFLDYPSESTPIDGDNLNNNFSELNTNKLDKSVVKIEKTTSDTDTYGCNYINQIETNQGILSNLNTTNKNNLVNAINEVNTNDIIKGTYSTTETIVGKWIDGKPLYRKVLSFNITITVNEIFTKSHGISNVDQLFIRNAYLYVPTTGLNYPLNQIGYNGNLTEKCYCWSDRNNVYLSANSGYNTNWYKCFILEYTKTTD